jgi:limonene 1,2-monooxygenase
MGRGSASTTVAGGSAIASPELFIAAAGRTRHIKLGTGVVSLPYHHPLMVTNRMVLLDHMTKARAMLGVGPGTLVSDAYMLGIDPPTQRRRMDESLGIIIRLLTETQPITYEAEWFTLKEAVAHLRPYTQPTFPSPLRPCSRLRVWCWQASTGQACSRSAPSVEVALRRT